MATKTQATHPTHLQHKNHSLYNSSVFTIYLILISDSKVNDEVHRICIYYTLFNNLLSSIADLVLTYQVLSRNSKVSLKHWDYTYKTRSCQTRYLCKNKKWAEKRYHIDCSTIYYQDAVIINY